MTNASIPKGISSRCWKGEASFASGLKLLMASIFFFLWTLHLWGLPLQVLVRVPAAIPISFPMPMSIPLPRPVGVFGNDLSVEHQHEIDAVTESKAKSEDSCTIANENTSCTAVVTETEDNVNMNADADVDECVQDEESDDANPSVIPLAVLIPLTGVPYIVWHIVRYVSLQLYLGN
eukprot:1001239_1